MIDIMSFFRSKKSQKKTASQIAKERLKLVLVHDRSDCNADLLESIRKDIMEVLSKYMEIDMDALDIQISTTRLDENDDTEVPALYANIPIKTIKQVRDDKKDDDKSSKKDDKKEEKKSDDKKSETKKSEDKKSDDKEEKEEDKKSEDKEDK